MIDLRPGVVVALMPYFLQSFNPFGVIFAIDLIRLAIK
jgi:hypothetical protein